MKNRLISLKQQELTLMKSYIESIKFEIEILSNMMIWIRVDFSALKGEEVTWLN